MPEMHEVRHEPTLAPGQDLTLHPGDDVRGAELLEADGDNDVANDRPALGAVTQDDPMPLGLHTYPDTDDDGGLTLVAVFEDITGAESCARDLERRGWGIEVSVLERRGDGPEQGLRPGAIITGPGYGLSTPDQSPPRNPPMGAGVAVGATLGATVGWLATNYVLPGFPPLVATGGLISTMAGAGLGAFLGGLTEYGTSEQQDGDDATLYAGQVRRGGVLLLARTDEEDADRVRRAIEFWQPLEIRVQ
ncbi:MAG TPA: hypothetical protein VNT01_17670 [Symbiobacteriaceae bacterium]|nr:hypothetical protein [Symbiobacteriaceae bacterium]